MIQKFTTGDKLLFVSLLLLTVYIFKITYTGRKEGSTVVINVNNKEFGRFPLKTDRHIAVEGPIGVTDVVIKDGKVGITNSPCPNKMCVKFGWINHVGRVSVCLPNKVVIKIIGDEDTDIDAIAG